MEKKDLKELAEQIIIRDEFEKDSNIAGVVSTTINNEKILASAIICDKNFDVKDRSYSLVDIDNKDVLFKEGPVMVETVKKLKIRPDILLVNGPGIVHRKLGIASYIGLKLDISSIGVSKNILFGKVVDGLVYVENEIKGYEVKTREGSRPIYVSPGHKVSLKSSVNIVKNCLKWPHKMPEPLALANKYANKIKKGFLEEARQ